MHSALKLARMSTPIIVADMALEQTRRPGDRYIQQAGIETTLDRATSPGSRGRKSVSSNIRDRPLLNLEAIHL